MSSRLHSFYASHYDVNIILESLSLLGVKHRSYFIKCCQGQTYPRVTETYRLADMGRRIPKILVPHDGIITATHTLEIFENVRYLFSSQLFAGFLLDLFRNYQFPAEIEAIMRRDGWHAEIRCCETENPGRRLNFDCWMDPQKFHEQLHPEIPANPMAHRIIYSILRRWKKECLARVHYPRMNDKNMSWSTKRSYESVFGESWDYRLRGMFSQRVYQQVKDRKGISLGGVNELRQVWTPAAVKPRNYWSMGGESYNASAHTQDIWNLLVDLSPSTNHVSRLLPGRLEVREGKICRVYDFTTFTSEMHQQMHFLRRLAPFAGEDMITYMEADVGLVDQSFGAMIDDYVDKCAARPGVSYERRLKKRLETTFHNHAAGLGIFGNLATSTFVHFGFELELIGDEDEINTGGDDGEVMMYPDEIDEFDYHQPIIGVYHPDKMFRSDEEGCISYKRKLVQLRDKLILYPLVIWPTSPTLLYALYKIKDRRFNYFDDDLISLSDRLGSLGVELLRFITSIHWLKFNIEPYELEWVLHYLRWVVDEAERLYTPMVAQLPQCGGDFLWPVIPRRLEDFDTLPVERMVMEVYHGEVLLSVRDLLPDPSLVQNRFQSSKFETNATQRITFLKHLGYLDVKPKKEKLTGEEGYSRLLKEFGVTLPIVYEVVVIADLPDKFL